MNTNLGYTKLSLTDVNVLLSGGGHKSLSDFIGSVSWDSTNKKITYTPVGGTATNLVSFGSNAFNSTSYLPISGGTLTGQLVTKAGTAAATLYGIKFGNTTLTSLSGQALWLGGNVRFSDVTNWDWNKWAGLKYDSSNKIIYLGIADGTIFNANSAQSDGKLYLPGISSIYVGNGTTAVSLATHTHSSITDGTYTYTASGIATIANQASTAYNWGNHNGKYVTNRTTVFVKQQNEGVWVPFLTFNINSYQLQATISFIRYPCETERTNWEFVNFTVRKTSTSVSPILMVCELGTDSPNQYKAVSDNGTDWTVYIRSKNNTKEGYAPAGTIVHYHSNAINSYKYAIGTKTDTIPTGTYSANNTSANRAYYADYSGYAKRLVNNTTTNVGGLTYSENTASSSTDVTGAYVGYQSSATKNCIIRLQSSTTAKSYIDLIFDTTSDNLWYRRVTNSGTPSLSRILMKNTPDVLCNYDTVNSYNSIQGNKIFKWFGTTTPYGTESTTKYGAILQWTATPDNTPGATSQDSWYYQLITNTVDNKIRYRRRVNSNSWTTPVTLATLDDISGFISSSEIYDWAKAATKPSYSYTEITNLSQASVKYATTAGSTSVLNWSTSAYLGPIEALLFRPGNRFAGLPAAQITIEYSNNASTYTSYGATDDQKRAFLTQFGASFVLGKNTSYSTANNNHRLRVTIDCKGTASVYSELQRAIIYVSQNGGLNCYVIFSVSNDNSTYTTLGTYSISGWSGYNAIPLGIVADGRDTSSHSTNFYRYLRFEFKQTFAAQSNSSNCGLVVYGIEAFGGVAWNSPSIMARDGRPYTYSYTGATTFVSNVTAANFYSSSDIRYKNVLDQVEVNINDIAKLPIFNFKWNDKEDAHVYSGTSAQDVQKILPNIITEDENKLKLNYSVLGVIEGVISAREIVKLKEKIKELEEKLEQYGRFNSNSQQT